MATQFERRRAVPAFVVARSGNHHAQYANRKVN
jgi:hypothetical protein